MCSSAAHFFWFTISARGTRPVCDLPQGSSIRAAVMCSILLAGFSQEKERCGRERVEREDSVHVGQWLRNREMVTGLDCGFAKRDLDQGSTLFRQFWQ